MRVIARLSIVPILASREYKIEEYNILKECMKYVCFRAYKKGIILNTVFFLLPFSLLF